MNMHVLLGKKKEMTQIFKEDGSVIPVTILEVGPCTVLEVKTNPRGQRVAVLGFGTKKSQNKAQDGQWGEYGSFAFVKEFPVPDSFEAASGEKISADSFEAGQKVTVTGTSKGKGFQGVVKRHGFKGSKATHGNKDQLRMPGSIGALGPQKVFKGIRMAGRTGGNRVTVKNLEIVEIDATKNIVAIKGAVPGPRNSFVTVMKSDGNVWHK